MKLQFDFQVIYLRRETAFVQSGGTHRRVVHGRFWV